MEGDCARQGKVVPTSCPVLWEAALCAQCQLLVATDEVSGWSKLCQGNSDTDFIELCKQRGG